MFVGECFVPDRLYRRLPNLPFSDDDSGPPSKLEVGFLALLLLVPLPLLLLLLLFATSNHNETRKDGKVTICF